MALEHLRDNVFPDPVTLKYGDWGAIPPTLQKLPADGSLCGSVVGDAGSAGTVILTHMSPHDAYNFYAPLIEAAGCSPASDPNVGALFTFLCSDATPAVIDASDPNHSYVVLGFG
jgi:hypothetical protein